MAISRMANGFYTFSDNHFKSMNKKDLIIYIRTIEKNWENSLITNNIQYNNCIKLLAEERNKAIDDFSEKANKKISDFVLEHKDNLDFASGISVAWSIIDEIAEQMKVGGKDE